MDGFSKFKRQKFGFDAPYGTLPLVFFNLLPVWSEKFKMAAVDNIFLNNSRSNGRIFEIPTAYDHYTWHAHVKMLVLKIYFRFARKKSKWLPKSGFLRITKDLMDGFSKFQRHIITIDGMHM